MALALALAALILVAPAQAATVTATQSTKYRPKVAVRFTAGAGTLSSFKISYGGQRILCAVVEPVSKASKISFASDPTNRYQLTSYAGGSSCSGRIVAVQSLLTAPCSSTGDIKAKLSGNTLKTLPGTIMLPDGTSATLYVNEGCGSGYGASKIYFVRFASSGGSPMFNGLSVTENLNTTGQPNTCNFNTNFPSTWTIGEAPAPSNSIDDANGKCGFGSTETCETIINQSFTIGNCTTPTNTINFTMTNGVGSLTRSDSGGQ